MMRSTNVSWLKSCGTQWKSTQTFSFLLQVQQLRYLMESLGFNYCLHRGCGLLLCSLQKHWQRVCISLSDRNTGLPEDNTSFFKTIFSDIVNFVQLYDLNFLSLWWSLFNLRRRRTLLARICTHYKLVHFPFPWGKIVHKEVCFGLKETSVGHGRIKFAYSHKLTLRLSDVENWSGDAENLKGLGQREF